jgi:hypothetical protein
VAGNITYERRITDNPTLVHSNDSDVLTFLAALPTPSFHANTAGQLWKLDAAGDEIGGAGSAVLVSAEALKRIKTRRL